MKQLSEAAAAARREYNRKYREAHRDAINARRREWAKENADKVKATKARYWEKKAAAQQNADIEE